MRTPPRLMLGLAASALALSACSSAVSDSSSAGSTGDTRVDGGVLRLATSMDLVPTQLYQGSDPALTISGLVYDSLVEYQGESLEPQPALATSWEFNDDRTALTLQLRDDVSFHDGKPLTSEDVATSLRTYAEPERFGQMASTASSITDIDTSDEHAVTLTFKHPLSNVFDLLSMVPIVDGDTQKDADAGQEFNGTGAFEFASWAPGTGLTFEANEDYWDGAPTLDTVELKVIADPQTQVAQLRSGQVDLLLTPSNRDIAGLEKTNGFQAITLDGGSRSYYLGLNVAGKGLGDVRVRQAINHALDRQRILDEVFQGRGEVANLPWPTFSPAYDEEANQTYTGDGAKAKALLAEVGEVPEIALNYSSVMPMQEQLALIVKDNLEAVGLQVKLTAQDAAAGGNLLAKAGFPGMWLYPHAFADFTPATLTLSAYPFNAFRNASNFDDADYQAHATAAWQLTDLTGDDAAQVYSALNKDLLEGSFVQNLVTYTHEWVATDRVHDLGWTKRGEIELDDAYLSE